MLPLVETVIGFAVIMAMLSILVKSLSSAFKNHIEYYSKNLKSEVMRLVTGTFENSSKKMQNKYLLNQIQWKRLGKEFLDRDNMAWLLKKLGAGEDAMQYLNARIKVHASNIQHAFEKRSKNLALALGIALCLGMNINAFTIWDTLYNNEEARAKFASQEYVESAENSFKKYEDELKALEIVQGTEASDQKENIIKQRDALQKQIAHFRGEISFGIGKIWTTEKVTGKIFFYEFFSSLLTGILVSIGAPYWHDILRAIASFRKGQ